MNGKTCVVTGANAGIGKATAAGLASKGAAVALVCRDGERGQHARAEIIEQTGNERIALHLADLSSQASIRRLVQELSARYSKIDVLVNNAGMISRRRELTIEGFEAQFAVNHLAYFLLTNLLLDLLKAGGPARIVNVSSEAHKFGHIHFDDLHLEQSYTPLKAYSQSKLANILFTYELARRLSESSVTANCLHPGVVATQLLNDFFGFPRFFSRVNRLFVSSPQRGAQTSLHVATSPDVREVSGKYFVRRRPANSSPASYDRQAAERLWQVSAELTGIA